MENKKNSEKSLFTPENFPVRGSLGLLAYGDIAFKMWRDVKKDTKENDR